MGWYIRRLRSMSAAEVLWRLRTTVHQWADRCAAPARARFVPLERIARDPTKWLETESRIFGSHGPVPGKLPPLDGVLDHAWLVLAQQADKISRHRLTLFDLIDHDLGDEIRWNYEYKAGKSAPMDFAPTVDYRDYHQTGDCKFVWEPNRHAHLVTLGRAYRMTGETRFAEEVVHQLSSWMEQCPYGYGMNWRSPLELGIRLINWVWSLELIRPSGLITPERLPGLPSVVYRHLWDISRHYSKYSSANNHLIGEAAGVFIGASYFSFLRDAERWRKQSREILSREIIAQTWPDGANREQALGYHLFALEFFLLAGLVAKNSGEDFPDFYWDRLEQMFAFICALAEGGDQLPMFGDCDDGYVLDLGRGSDNARSLLAVGAVLFKRPDFKFESRQFSEPAFWLSGQAGYQTWREIPDLPPSEKIESRAFAESGLYLLQSGHRGGDDRISVTFDCGELGFGAIAAHGHADALSVTLRVAGTDILVDPGTYDYFTYERWRDYFRGTSAHNTVVVDERDQSDKNGSFLWGRRAKARCLEWRPEQSGGRVSGEHDGYARLSGGSVVHRRSVLLDGERNIVLIEDRLSGTGCHTAKLYLHCAECCAVEADNDFYLVDAGQTQLGIAFDPCLTVNVLKGSEGPIGGWVSRGYHHKEPSAVFVAGCEWRDELIVKTRIKSL